LYKNINVIKILTLLNFFKVKKEKRECNKGILYYKLKLKESRKRKTNIVSKRVKNANISIKNKSLILRKFKSTL